MIDNNKNKEQRDDIMPLLLPSILGICLCLICICGMTWAWFSASISAPAQKMTAAYYEITVESVMDGDAAIAAEKDGYNLEADKLYRVTLKASGSVKECGGYCLIENKEAAIKLYTSSIMPENSLVIEITPTVSGIYTFTGVWGSIPTGTENIIQGVETDSEASTASP